MVNIILRPVPKGPCRTYKAADTHTKTHQYTETNADAENRRQTPKAKRLPPKP